jgi:hypothetical protein
MKTPDKHTMGQQWWQETAEELAAKVRGYFTTRDGKVEIPENLDGDCDLYATASRLTTRTVQPGGTTSMAELQLGGHVRLPNTTQAVLADAHKTVENSVVRSIISGMEERMEELNKRDKRPASVCFRAGNIAELEAQIAGLKKKFGVE